MSYELSTISYPSAEGSPIPTSPCIQAEVGWYNVARCDGTGRRMDAACGVDKLMPVRRYT